MRTTVRKQPTTTASTCSLTENTIDVDDPLSDLFHNNQKMSPQCPRKKKTQRFAEEMRSYQVVPSGAEKGVRGSRSGIRTQEQFVNSSTTRQKGDWTDQLAVRQSVANEPKAQVEPDINLDEHGADTISELDDDGTLGHAKYSKGLSSELPEDPDILFRMQDLLLGATNVSISKTTEDILAPPSSPLLRNHKPVHPKIIHTNTQRPSSSERAISKPGVVLNPGEISRLHHIQGALVELGLKRQGTGDGGGKLRHNTEAFDYINASVSRNPSSKKIQIAKDEDLGRFKRSTSSYRNTLLDPSSVSRAALHPVHYKVDEKEVAKEIVEKIHAKSSSPHTIRRHSFENGVSPDLPASLCVRPRQTRSVDTDLYSSDDNDNKSSPKKEFRRWGKPVLPEVFFRSKVKSSPMTPSMSTVPTSISSAASSRSQLLSSTSPLQSPLRKLLNVDFNAEL